eukprot:TRINITY_DN21666_c0_g1_i1.p1 TRINITY_DN21666_c0_g1~~TRINITY_DN21666_c0_g1_i1.p1  ORF type:complete len:722 (+),score=113.90 TRINITY_DN21666_c0_g1_i1:292-2166(+)
MFGSGKTYLGLHFLSMLKASQPMCDTLRKDFAKELPILLKFEYVLLDLRLTSFDSMDLVSPMVLLISQEVLYLCKEEPCYKELKNWLENATTQINVMVLLDNINRITKKRFFFHVDEIDLILDSLHKHNRTNSIDEVSTYYKFWKDVVFQCFLTGNQCYVSGRSSFLYTLSKGYYKQENLRSPCICKARTLDPLSQTNIKEIMIHLKRFSMEEVELLSERIYTITAGIPRFVKYCIDIAKNLIGKSDDECLNIAYQYCKQKAVIELCPYISLPENLKGIYLELIRISIFHIPINPDLPVSPHDFWSIPEKSCPTIRDCLSLLPVYTANCPSDVSKVVVIFSKLQHYSLLEDPSFQIDSFKKRLPIPSLYLKSLSVADWRTGEPFERCIGESIILRDTYSTLEDCTYAELYPFLKCTVLANVKVSPLQKRCFLPHFTTMNTLPVEQIRNFMNSPLQDDILRVSNQQKSVVFQHVKSNTIYTSSKTSAADIYKFEANGIYIGWQTKSMKSCLTPGVFKEEVEKSILHDHLTQNVCFILVFVIEKLSDTLFAECSFPVYHDDLCLAYQFNPQTTIKVRQGTTDMEGNRRSKEIPWSIPNGIQVVVLTPAGIKFLLGKPIYEILKYDK